MDENRMARRVLVEGGYEGVMEMKGGYEGTAVGLDGWCEGGLGQQRHDEYA